MIHGEPEVIERDGQKVVVDENGDELVCRKDSGLQSGADRIYHRIDAEFYEATGDVRPICGHEQHRAEPSWILRRRIDIESNWRGCRYQKCYGDYDFSERQKTGGSLAWKLSSMTVDEFDDAVETARGER